MPRKKLELKLGTFVRTEDNRSGFITGIFESEAGTFYQLDNEMTLGAFISAGDVVSIATMQTVIKRPRKNRRSPQKSTGLIQRSGLDDGSDFGGRLANDNDLHAESGSDNSSGDGNNIEMPMPEPIPWEEDGPVMGQEP